MSDHVEIERKYAVDVGCPLPDLDGVQDGVHLGEPSAFELEACYFDTSDLRLSAANITLRRRTGGPDDGWHLKLPAGRDARHEIQVPLDHDGPLDPHPHPHTVPARLAALVAGHARGRDLVPIAELATVRIERDLFGGDGRVLAKIADDTVTGRVLTSQEDGGPPIPATTWREIEVELVDGSRRLLKDVGRRLRHHGARRSTAGSKLSQVLGGAPTALVDPLAGGPAERPAEDPLSRYLTAQAARLLAHDPLVRLSDHDDDSVHQMRVTTRRIRSALRARRSLLDARAVEDLDAELRWLAGSLGEVRDLEVVRARVETLLAELAVPGPPPRWARDSAALEAQARDRLRADLLTTRYYGLLDTLGSFAARPPRIATVSHDSAEMSARALRSAWRKMGSAYDAAFDQPPGERRDTALHDLRKKAKRARYAAEAAADTLGTPATEAASRTEQLQDVLGTWHDSVMSLRHIQELARKRSTTKADAFTLGRLAEIERFRGARALDGLPAAWRRAVPLTALRP